ncbi:chorismate mutase [Plesiomonas shigelloides]|uniref:chorismate mutase n=1 Tax=Plesiomonas shigelloides TaxID=703 RepID=UPI000D5659C9|nr:chorismate mutase [Plesiomonas shigelloides]PVU64800.1 chorismate mutase [Plesiomonas shigelloides]
MNSISGSLDEVRVKIDEVDRKIVALISERSFYVKQAAQFKKVKEDVKAPQRVEQVINKVKSLAIENNVNPVVVEAVYRTMIAEFIKYELCEYDQLEKLSRAP